MAWADPAALDRARRFRRRLERPVHRPRHRRRTAVVLNRPRLPADRPGLAGRQADAADAHQLLSTVASARLRSPCVQAVRSLGRNSQRHSAGRKTIAAIILTTNMKVSMTPMSAWNLRSENTQVPTPTARVRAV